MRGIRSFLPRRFSQGYFPAWQFPHTFFLDIPSNRFPPWKILFHEQTIVALKDVAFAIGLAANPKAIQFREKNTK